jgi:hypothetical protein
MSKPPCPVREGATSVSSGRADHEPRAEIGEGGKIALAWWIDLSYARFNAVQDWAECLSVCWTPGNRKANLCKEVIAAVGEDEAYRAVQKYIEYAVSFVRYEVRRILQA